VHLITVKTMAAPGGKFFIEDTLNSNVKAKHHESYEQLWETKWKKPVWSRSGISIHCMTGPRARISTPA
jgi:hypothetical protein